MKTTMLLCLLTFCAEVLFCQKTGWSLSNQPATTRNLNDIYAFDLSTAISVGYKGSILKTTNGGANWQSLFSDTTQTFTAVHFVNSQVGWTVGWNREILKTTDGGLNWTQQFSTMNYRHCYDVFFIDANTGWTICRDDWPLLKVVVYKTTDGGKNWTSALPGHTSNSYSIFFVNSSIGWMVGEGGNIAKSTNGGLDWSFQTNETTEALRSVFFIDPNVGWAVGANGRVLKTTNGGSSWDAIGIGNLVTLQSVRFVDAQTGWVVGAGGLILKTTDGGSSWAVQKSGTAKNLCSVYPLSAMSGWAVGDSGTVLTTTDGGGVMLYPPTLRSPANSSSGISTNPVLKWNAAIGATSYYLQVSDKDDFVSTKVSQSISDTIFALGGLIENMTYYWRVYVQYQNGNSNWSEIRRFFTYSTGTGWNAQASWSTGDIKSIFFINAQTGWSVYREVRNGVLQDCVTKTTDGGTNWNRKVLNSQGMVSVYFVNSMNGWISCGYGDVLKTTDGGANWTKTSNISSQSFFSCHFVDTQTGWIAGDAGIYKTTDGGTTWIKQPLSGFIIQAVHFVDALTGWAAGSGRKIVKTTDGGSTWKEQLTDNGTYVDLSSIFFANAQTGWAVGNRGTCVKTTDGGNQWTALSPGTSQSFQSVRFVNSNVGWIVGTAGVIMKTTDGGEHWGTQSSRIKDHRFNSSCFIDSLTGWIAGEDGTILKTTTGGGTTLYQPILEYPADRSTAVPANPILRWNATSGATFYGLQVATDSLFSKLIINDSAVTTPSKQIGPLLPSSTYFWKVNARSADGAGEYSRISRFTTMVSFPTIALNRTSIAFGSVAQNAMKVDSISLSNSSTSTLIVDSIYTKSSVFTSNQTSASVVSMPVYIRVTFRPTGVGAFGDTLFLRNNSATPLVKIRLSGNGTLTGVEKVGIEIPTVFSVSQNYPNPFNASTMIDYSLPQTANVTLRIFNALGQEVALLVNERREAGYYQVTWNATVPSGIYFYRMQAGGFVETKKMILVR